MAIFSVKSKAKKAEEKNETVAEITPARKYVPKHARSESSQAIEEISIANQMQRQDSSFYSIPADASHPQGIAPNTSLRGSSAPSTLNRGHTGNDAFTTTSRECCSPGALRKLQANDPSLGYTKVAIARHDQGWANGSSDSGYESAGPSRVPSEQNLDDMRQCLPRAALLPELRNGDDARSERSIKSAAKKTRFQVSTEPVIPAEPAASAVLASSGAQGTSAERAPPAASMPSTVPVHVGEHLPSQIVNLAPLEGFKVNKKGKVLDEEGEVIGELAEGDLLDCVRQKVNAKGQVMDDFGKVVGTVKPTATLLPFLTVVPPNGMQPSPSVDDESSSTKAPQSPTLDAQSIPEAARRSPRSASERSLSDLSKVYARPAMSSVPENNVPGEEAPVASPELFAYKGEIPSAPPQHVRRCSSSPPPFFDLPTPVRKPNRPRRISSGGMSSKSLGKQPIGHSSMRSYGSYEYSPNSSDDGTETSNSEDGKLPSIAYTRPGSVRSATTVSTAKPRTYFSHAGRITVNPNEPTPHQKEPPKTKLANELSASRPADVAVKEEKKKTKFGLRFGKK